MTFERLLLYDMHRYELCHVYVPGLEVGSWWFGPLVNLFVGEEPASTEKYCFVWNIGATHGIEDCAYVFKCSVCSYFSCESRIVARVP